MPEFPDIIVYVEKLDALLRGHALQRVRLASPFVLRSVTPTPSSLVGLQVVGMARLGKRIVFHFGDVAAPHADTDPHLVLHLMIAGRLKWADKDAAVPGKIGVAAFDFDHGTLLLTEASPKKRASIHIVSGAAGVAAHDPGGVEVVDGDVDVFLRELRAHKHTLKRALTDPRIFSGIGNAYSDEILHRAQLSPAQLTTNLSDDDARKLFSAMQDVMHEWTARLREESKAVALPAKVTAFHKAMAVHGKAGEPCPRCGSPVQKIAYADNETNYCATCQTGGKLLKDRGLSRLLKDDWPRSLDELESLKRAHRGDA